MSRILVRRLPKFLSLGLVPEIPEGLILKGSRPYKTIETNSLDQIELGPLVDKAITKPILRQLPPEWQMLPGVTDFLTEPEYEI